MKKTRLYNAHVELKGKMVDFCGWSLPVQFAGLTEEHLAVRTSGGIFDVSHMGEIFIRGPQALDAVQYITANNVAKLSPGKIHYSCFPNEKGGIVDDILVYMISTQEYLLVVNAANLEKDFKWVTEKTKPFDIQIENASDDYSQIAIQGPMAEKLLSAYTQADLASIPYYQFVQDKIKNMDAIISRTGYTGEDGFEIYLREDEKTMTALLLDLAHQGAKYKIVPAGLGARDTLRLEAAMSLYGNDLDDTHTILEANLGWILKLQKGDFIGKDILVKQKTDGLKIKLAGFELIDKGIARHGYPVFSQGKEVSTVTSGTYAPYLKKSIGLAYLPINLTEIGTEIYIKIRDKLVLARVIPTPFYKREK
jgi:aminomethyltransferase